MPELRRDPISRNWVIIAKERSKRPNDFTSPEENRKGGFCPFCYGNESSTPPEVFALRAKDTTPDSPGWSIRIVPNKFPAVSYEGEINLNLEGLKESMNALGVHEVIVEGPDHDSHLGEHSIEHVEKLVDCIADRYKTLVKKSKHQYIQIFKNSGAIAGASLEHTHWQIISIPIIPSIIENELEGANIYYKEKGKCVFCDLMAEEQIDKERIIIENKDFLVFCPYASRFPYETWIVPKKHNHDFAGINDEEQKSLAISLKEIINKFEKAFNYPPYNLVIHTSPIGVECNDYYHWHIEILPRLSITAGFEWGTGCIINPTAPEVAADALKTKE